MWQKLAPPYSNADYNKEVTLNWRESIMAAKPQKEYFK